MYGPWPDKCDSHFLKPLKTELSQLDPFFGGLFSVYGVYSMFSGRWGTGAGRFGESEGEPRANDPNDCFLR
jgi:hypothetical protein